MEEYFQVAPPDPEKYLPFLEKWGVEAPTPEDVAAIHRFIVVHRETDFILSNNKHTQEAFTTAFYLVLDKRVNLLREPAIAEFLDQHQISTDDEFLQDMQTFATETEVADATWFHEQIEIHGRDPGLLWCAIQNPALMGEILQNFQSTDIFWEWVAATRR